MTTVYSFYDELEGRLHLVKDDSGKSEQEFVCSYLKENAELDKDEFAMLEQIIMQTQSTGDITAALVDWEFKFLCVTI